MGKRNLFAKTVVWACLAAGFPAVAQAQMFVEAEALLFGRNNQGKTQIISGTETFSTESDFGGEAGFRLSGGWELEKYRFDVSYSEVSPWTSSISGEFSDDIQLIRPNFTPGTDALLSVDGLLARAALKSAEDTSTTPITYDSFALNPTSTSYPLEKDFWSDSRSTWRAAEINFGTSYYQKRWRIAGGYRYMNLDESNGSFISGIFNDAGSNLPITASSLFDAGATQSFGGGDILDGDKVIYGLSSSTENEFHGFQATFAVRIIERDRFKLEGFLKPGIFGNQVSGRVTEVVLVDHVAPGSGDSGYARVFEDSKVKPAFGGNFGLKGSIALTDYIEIVGGGEVNVMSGVALSSNQYSGINQFRNSYNLNNKGTMANYGGTIGLRIYW